MSSINGYTPSSSMFPPQQPGRIDYDKPMHNPLDQTAGDDAEEFDAETQTWQPTKALGNGRYSALGDPYREPIDFEIKAPHHQTPQALQAAPEALRLRPEQGSPHNTQMRFTVKPEDYRPAMEIFNDLAQSKNIRTKQESDTYDLNDYGGGFGLYNTIAFQLQPNANEKLDSPALLMRFDDFQREFQEELSEAGIRNYAPA